MSRTAVILLTLGLSLGSSLLAGAQAPTPAVPAVISQETVSLDDDGQPQPKVARAPAAERQTPPPPPPAPAAPRTPAAPPTPLAPPAPPAASRRMVNLQLEFTITDQMGSGASDKKTVTMIAADGTWGRIRASATARPRGSVPVAVSLNIDARPLLVANDGIQMELTIEYRPIGMATSGETPQVDTTNLNQSLFVILQNGKSMVLSQAADPVTDRKIVVEAKATVLK